MTKARNTDWKWPVSPACPYCQAGLSSRPNPCRKGQFKCRECGKAIQVRPKTYAFPTPYLTKYESGLEDCVAHMETMASIWCNEEFYAKVKSQLSDKFGGSPSIADIIWEILLLNKLHHCTDWMDHLDLRTVQKAFLRLEITQEWRKPEWDYYERGLSQRVFREHDEDSAIELLPHTSKKDLSGVKRTFFSIWPINKRGKPVIYLAPVSRESVQRDMEKEGAMRTTVIRLKAQFPGETEEWYALAAHELNPT